MNSFQLEGLMSDGTTFLRRLASAPTKSPHCVYRLILVQYLYGNCTGIKRDMQVVPLARVSLQTYGRLLAPCTASSKA
jgi:hypothetical protein